MRTVLVGERPPEVEDLLQRRRALGQDTPPHTFNPSAEIVVEIVSPGDESRLKYDFYFRAGVAEVGIVDPQPKTVEWFVRDSTAFRPAEHSNLFNISTTDLAELIDWPR